MQVCVSLLIVVQVFSFLREASGMSLHTFPIFLCYLCLSTPMFSFSVFFFFIFLVFLWLSLPFHFSLILSPYLLPSPRSRFSLFILYHPFSPFSPSFPSPFPTSRPKYAATHQHRPCSARPLARRELRPTLRQVIIRLRRVRRSLGLIPVRRDFYDINGGHEGGEEGGGGWGRGRGRS